MEARCLGVLSCLCNSCSAQQNAHASRSQLSDYFNQQIAQQNAQNLPRGYWLQSSREMTRADLGLAEPDFSPKAVHDVMMRTNRLYRFAQHYANALGVEGNKLTDAPYSFWLGSDV